MIVNTWFYFKTIAISYDNIVNFKKLFQKVLLPFSDINFMFDDVDHEEIEPQTAEMRSRNIKVTRQRITKTFKAQMDGAIAATDGVPLQENQEEQNDRNFIVQKITTFDDANVAHDTNDGRDEYVIHNTMPVPDLEMFLCRPIVIDSQVWSSSDALGTSKGVYTFPQALYTTTMMNKLEKIAFWRPDIEVSFRMNGTPMHFGRLVVAWIPQATTLNGAFYNTYQNMFSHRWVQISACTNQVTTIRIPFTHYKEFMSIGGVNEDLFTMFVFVSVPLGSVNGAAPNIDYTVYARVVKPNLVGYNYTTNWAAQSNNNVIVPAQRMRVRRGKGEAEQKTEQGKVVSSSINQLADAVSNFDWVPVVGKFADPVAQAMKFVGGVTKWFGLSIPPNLVHTQPIQIRQPRMLQFEDLPTTLVLAPNADGTVSRDYSLVNDTECAASILHFMQRPSLMSLVQITSSDIAGTNIFKINVHPLRCWVEDYVNPVNPAQFRATPIYYMSRMARQWRGSMRFHLSFICSRFHSLRVRVWYSPYAIIGTVGAPNPTETQTTDLISTVLDITDETDYSFTIPYCQQSEWLDVYPVTPGGGLGSYTISNGYLGVQVINPLTSGATTVNPIFMQVFVSAGADFQLATPDTELVLSAGVFDPQSNFSVSDCQVPSLSMDCLQEKEYPVLGNVGKGRINHRVYQSTEITGVKQLANMLCPIDATDPGATSLTLPVPMTIYPLGDYKPYTTPYYKNYLVNIMTVFRYFRGGLRFSARTIDQDATAQVCTAYIDQTGANILGPLGTPYDFNDLFTAPPGGLYMANAQFNRIAANPVDVTVPWYYKFKCSRTNVDSGGSLSSDPQWGPVLKFAALSPNNEFWCLFIGGADDMIHGFQLGIPSLTTTGPP